MLIRQLHNSLVRAWLKLHPRRQPPGLKTMTWWDSLENVQRWGNLSNGLAAIAGLVTAVAVVAALVIGFRASTLQKAVDEGKDLLIARANSTASLANEGLAKANLNIEDRKKENLELRKQVATLEAAAANAEAARLEMERGLEETKKEAARAAEGAVYAQNEIQWKERIQKELDKDFAPRRILRKSLGIKFLSQFRGTKFFVVTPNELEPHRLGAAIEDLLLKSNWDRVEPLSSRNESSSFTFGDNVQVDLKNRDDNSLHMAGDALSEFLQIENIECDSLSLVLRGGRDIPEDGVLRIVVGLKVNRHVQRLSREEELEVTVQDMDSRANLMERRASGALPHESILGPMPEEMWRKIAGSKPPSEEAILVVHSLSDEGFTWDPPIRDALGFAGWQVLCGVNHPSPEQTELHSNAVILRSDAPDDRREQAKYLHKVLTDAGFRVNFVESDSPPKGFAVTVVVCSSPRTEVDPPEARPEQE
ncbi:MAG: hypothetical protein AB7I57_17130 [Pirellulales bacterium]